MIDKNKLFIYLLESTKESLWIHKAMMSVFDLDSNLQRNMGYLKSFIISFISDNHELKMNELQEKYIRCIRLFFNHNIFWCCPDDFQFSLKQNLCKNQDRLSCG